MNSVLGKIDGKTDEWYGATLETPGTPMVDSGSGRPLILRIFEFAVKPQPSGTPSATKQQLFNLHWRQIRDMIWADGLVANTDVGPRVVVGKKRYRIFVLCEPKFRTMIAERPSSLQDIFKKLSK